MTSNIKTGVFKTVQDAVDHVRSAITSGRGHKSSLSDGTENAEAILRLVGMSGGKTRHTLNNLMSYPNINYVEVGSHIGSTFCSSIYNNPHIASATSVDNWSQFDDYSSTNVNGGTRDFFRANVKGTINSFSAVEPAMARYFLHDADFREFDFVAMCKNPIDMYFFDGPHTRQDQKDGIVCAADAIADIAIIMVDDWNWGGPRQGTFAALEEIGFHIHYQLEIYTPPAGFHPIKHDDVTMRPNRFAGSDWHNGISIMVVSRSHG
jgi:hypothetical protein